MSTIFTREELEGLKVDSLQYLSKYYGLPKGTKQEMVNALMQKFMQIDQTERNNSLATGNNSNETQYSVRVLRAMGMEEKPNG